MLSNILLVAIGGGAGSLCRYIFSLIATNMFGDSFPWGTIGVNLIGCLLIGINFSLFEEHIISPHMKLLIMTGFLGGLTTFSTYALDSTNFLELGNFFKAVMNIALNNIGCMGCVFVGIFLGKLV